MSDRYRCARIVLLAHLAAAAVSPVCRGESRALDGSGNNLANPQWGAAGTNFARLAPVDYADGVSAARLASRPNPRGVGLALLRQTESRPNARGLSGYVYAFGNLISHDSQLTIAGASEFVEFRIPVGDDLFAPNQLIRLTRSIFDPATGTGRDNPRQQINFATAFIDGSPIYGSDDLTASILRGGPANPGARLRTSSDINGDGENLLPRNAFGPAPDVSFVAGDARVNDNIVLTAMHTVFMREHNRLVDVLAAEHPERSAEEHFQRARKLVGAQLQAITFNEFLPALLGPAAPSASGQYDPHVNPAVLNEFPTVFLRIGHSMLTDDFKRVQNDGQPAPGGPLPLIEAFENPAQLTTSTDLDLFLKGLSVEVQEEVDLKLVDGMRIALLDAIDIQRARDHGLPDYNTLREAYGLSRVKSFAEIASDVATQNAIAAVYGNVDSIDPFVGALAEDHLPGAAVGALVAAGYRAQFERLRAGDRFWYENDPDFSVLELAALRQTRLADVIQRNSGVTNLQSNVFFAVPEPTWLMLALGILAVLMVRQVVRWTTASSPATGAFTPVYGASRWSSRLANRRTAAILYELASRRTTVNWSSTWKSSPTARLVGIRVPLVSRPAIRSCLMNHSRYRSFWMFTVLLAALAPRADAEIIYESGALGPTGLARGTVVATVVASDVYTGVRFHLTEPVVTSQVGGHFVDRSNGTFFGAIISLDNENDFPDSGDLTTPDVLGAAVLTFPAPSAEVFGNLVLALDPGWYALVFGSGLLGTSGDGAAPRNNADIGDPSYIAFQPGSVFGWVNITTFPNHRFVVEGSIVPEPCSAALALAFLLSSGLKYGVRRLGLASHPRRHPPPLQVGL